MTTAGTADTVDHAEPDSDITPGRMRPGFFVGPTGRDKNIEKVWKRLAQEHGMRRL